jgi:hypothetical protein
MAVRAISRQTKKPSQKKAASKGGSGSGRRLRALRRLCCVSDRVLGIASRVVRSTLGLVELAFGLKFLVTGDLAGGSLVERTSAGAGEPLRGVSN